MNRFYLDTEFVDLGERVHLLSIGIAHQDGSTYYAESSETDYSLAGDWVTEHVLPNLGQIRKKTHMHIAQEIKFFVDRHNRTEFGPRFYGWYSAYDWYMLCSLFGGMLKVPKDWPHHCYDLKQLSDELNIKDLPLKDENDHHAKRDALWAKDAHEFMLLEKTKLPVPRVSEEAIHRYHRVHLPKLNTATCELGELALAMNLAIKETQSCILCGKDHGNLGCLEN